ncbi:MAG: tryptophan 7-halogenase, partial [Chloroflexi bacterium]|nr:tryptophan 7-halogenase [Chloroflexota bacterium]
GSVATLLAREGLDVILLEKAKHPRPQVGESLIPHFWHFADQLGFTQKILDEGFIAKAGGIVSWDGDMRQLKFSDFGYPGRGGLHIERDRFDYLLLEHAAEQGVRIWEEVVVRSVDFTDPRGPAVLYDDRRNGDSRPGRVDCKTVIDATGFNALLAGQFQCRKLHQQKDRFVSLWGYYRNASFIGADQKIYSADRVRAVKPVTYVTSFDEGWAWHIILRESTSVGLILYTAREKGVGKKGQEQYFRDTCASIPVLKDLLAPATYIEDSFFARPDYSYYSERIVGDHFYCIGDAAAFLDPIFSTGVTTAMYHAALCAWAVKASLKKPQRKPFYDQLFRDKVVQYYSFARLLIFGDFGAEGTDLELVKSIAKALPPNEVELLFSAATMVHRPGHLRRIAVEAGLIPEGDGEAFVADKTTPVQSLAV